MTKIDQLSINAIRILSADSVQQANSGHPGLPMGAAPMAYTLWSRHLRHNPQNPQWMDRDRFVLSAGHGSMLLYSLLYLFGYDLGMDDLKNFRQWGSKTPGHPEYGHTPGIETTTGPLGQGLANAVGMAMAEVHLAARFNRPGHEIINHYTYVLVGDGCMMEGVTSEAASLAGTLGLGKLIVLYDSNNITIEGETQLAFRENTGKRFEAYGWQVLEVEDGNDLEQLDAAIGAARKETGRPSLIIVPTTIGYGCEARQGKASAHGEPLGAENIRRTREFLGWEYEPFELPPVLHEYRNELLEKGKRLEEQWKEQWKAYEALYPEAARELLHWLEQDFPVERLAEDDFWQFENKPLATRSASEIVLNRLTAVIPNLFGGSADLAPSTKTLMKGSGDFSSFDRTGSNLHFGVREHAMGAIANGIAVHGGLRPYTATFFVFSDYMKPAIRLSAIMKLPVIHVLTHDSIGVGEDGPTHQPVEHLAALRSIPGLTVFRPADARETAAGWLVAMTRKHSPTALILTRQNLPHIHGTGREALRGAYTLMESGGKHPELILMASGSEVTLVYEAGVQLKTAGIDVRVISIPSWELFEEQPEEYKESLLPKSVRNRLVVEAGASFGWHRYVGLDGDIIAMDTFGASAPAERLFKEFGFTVENVVERAMRLVRKE